MLVPVDDGSLAKIVEHLLPRKGEEPRLDDSHLKDLLDDDDAGRIWWRSDPASSQGIGYWLIQYTDSSGALVRCRGGLTVPHMTLAGKPLSLAEKLAAARQVLIKARREWNRLDCSDKERFADYDG